jgi:hypothetical protein
MLKYIPRTSWRLLTFPNWSLVMTIELKPGSEHEHEGAGCDILLDKPAALETSLRDRDAPRLVGKCSSQGQELLTFLLPDVDMQYVGVQEMHGRKPRTNGHGSLKR